MGCCCVMQCTLPPPSRISLPGTDTTSLAPPNTPLSTAAAWLSLSGWPKLRGIRISGFNRCVSHR
ncbi:hypothetical protein B484DRAFT_450502 [Ochromonadaceae sp. CCMP2298]|nr:hypothetical protein B484DRAFT_450502 [Ochromonadaceae sp. CCMP2298]